MMARNLTVRVGNVNITQSLEEHQVKRIIKHANFSSSEKDFNFALLELKTPLIFNNNTQPIALPDQDEEIDKESQCFTSGYGWFCLYYDE